MQTCGDEVSLLEEMGRDGIVSFMHTMGVQGTNQLVPTTMKCTISIAFWMRYLNTGFSVDLVVDLVRVGMCGTS